MARFPRAIRVESDRLQEFISDRPHEMHSGPEAQLTPASTPQHINLEEQTAFYLQKLSQVDRLLRQPIETLIRHVNKHTAPGKECFRLPAHLSDHDECCEDRCPTATALCFSTIQRIKRLRRRFSWLSDDQRLIAFPKNLSNWLSSKSNRNEKHEMLNSPVFGYMNPLTASMVFRVLVESGESLVHCGLGFKTLFAMLWPLYRRFPDPLSAGARMEPWEPTAFVTAQCLLSLLKVKSVTLDRANLLCEMRSNLTRLSSLYSQVGERSRWQFNVALDALCTNLFRLSNISVAKEELRTIADCVRNKASGLGVSSTEDQNREAFQCICDHIADALRTVAKHATEGVKEAREELESLRRELSVLQITVYVTPTESAAEGIVVAGDKSVEAKFEQGMLHATEYVTPSESSSEGVEEAVKESGDAMVEQDSLHSTEYVMSSKSAAEGISVTGEANVEQRMFHTTDYVMPSEPRAESVKDLERDLITKPRMETFTASTAKREPKYKSSRIEKAPAFPKEESAKRTFQFSKEYASSVEYWQDLSDAACKGFNLCEELLVLIEQGASGCSHFLREDKKQQTPEKGGSGGDMSDKKECCKHSLKQTDCQQIQEALATLETANRKIARHFESQPIFNDTPRWCRTIMNREIANATAGNDTEYNPSELVSAIAVAVRWGLISTDLQVSDAVSKALQGAHADGSWRSGLPFFSPDNAQGVWPSTSETIWTLIAAIKLYPDVTVADEKLFDFLNWLERTQRNFSVVSPEETNKAADSFEVGSRSSVSQKETTLEFSGWPSERFSTTRKIHVATTAYSINAILEIRDLIEYRLLQLCQKRFTCLSFKDGLASIEPVDLGACHYSRINGILAKMAADTQGPNYEKAEYSWVLHGPPGSSKTKIAESLSADMWGHIKKWDQRRIGFIRITPADFTRRGEDRLDSEARLIFDLISHVRGVTVFFDEIDDLLYRRSAGSSDESYRPTFLALVVPAMLNRLADLRAACPRQQICFLLATNYVENIEPALIRRGRIDKALPVVYPDKSSRAAMLERHVAKRIEKTLDKKLDADSPNVSATLHRLVTALYPKAECAAGLPWMEIDGLLKDWLKDVFKKKAEIENLMTETETNKGMDMDKELVTGLQGILKHFPMFPAEGWDNERQTISPNHYTDRLRRGMKSPEFMNELAHFFFCCHESWTPESFAKEIANAFDDLKLEELIRKIAKIAKEEKRPLRKDTSQAQTPEARRVNVHGTLGNKLTETGEQVADEVSETDR